MTMKRIMLSILAITIACFVHGLVNAGPSAETGGPSLGTWAFTGKDDKGVSWTGTLAVQKLDTNRFDAGKYYSMCDLEMKSANSQKGISTPCTWEPNKRLVSFSTGETASYTAILSPDGKSMTRGTWTDSEKDFKTRKVTITRTGVWSAAFVGK